MITIADIEDIAFGGDGVARIDGKATFIPFTIDGERVEAKLIQNKKSFARGKVLSQLIASPHRVNPKCKWFGQCGGCQYQHISYEHQLEVKQKQLVDALSRIAKIENPPVEPIVASPKAYGYRNKIVLHGPGRPGFLSLDNKTLLPIEQCPLVADIINNTLPRILAENPRIEGDLTIRSGTEWTVWTYVDNEDSELQPERIADLNLLVPSTSFFQVNPGVTELLIQSVRAECSELEADHLIDAYCGMGLFALALADEFKTVLGIEFDRKAIDAARINAKNLEKKNCEFQCGATEDLLEKNLKKADLNRTCLILDPPRAGCSKEVLQTISLHAPCSLLYISCNPPRLARDITVLRETGYELKKAIPFDMFPQTAHFEVLAVLRKR